MTNNSKNCRVADLSTLPPIPSSRGILHPPYGQNEPSSPGKSPDEVETTKTPRHRFLTPAEWSIFAHGIGGVKDAEHHIPVHPTNWWWPPKGLPPGLYRDVVYLRTKSYYFFHVTSVLRWSLMILQIFLGATLTALGSFKLPNGIPITVLGALNTVIAGLLALIHNSGLPDRYRYDAAEFEEVEDHMTEILDTGIVPADKTIDQALAECFDLYHNAKATVAANMPVTYNSSQALQTGRRSVGLVPVSAGTVSARTVSAGTASPPKQPRPRVDGDESSPSGSTL